MIHFEFLILIMENLCWFLVLQKHVTFILKMEFIQESQASNRKHGFGVVHRGRIPIMQYVLSFFAHLFANLKQKIIILGYRLSRWYPGILPIKFQHSSWIIQGKICLPREYDRYYYSTFVNRAKSQNQVQRLDKKNRYL